MSTNHIQYRIKSEKVLCYIFENLRSLQLLCSHNRIEPFLGLFRTVYVDQFYTSIDLIKELHEMQLFVMGTVLSNRIPKNITIAKSSKQIKEMERGDAVKHVFHYKDKGGHDQKAGLVCWKDQNIVYSMMNDMTTLTMDECMRRGQGEV